MFIVTFGGFCTKRFHFSRWNTVLALERVLELIISTTLLLDLNMSFCHNPSRSRRTTDPHVHVQNRDSVALRVVCARASLLRKRTRGVTDGELPLKRAMNISCVPSVSVFSRESRVFPVVSSSAAWGFCSRCRRISSGGKCLDAFPQIIWLGNEAAVFVEHRSNTVHFKRLHSYTHLEKGRWSQSIKLKNNH